MVLQSDKRGRGRACDWGSDAVAATDLTFYPAADLSSSDTGGVVKERLDAHYLKLGDIQPIDAIRGWSKSWGAYSFYLGNIVKYAARMFIKNTPADNLVKLRFYVDELEQALEADADASTNGSPNLCGRIHWNSPSDSAWVCDHASGHSGPHCDGRHAWG